jgi:GT2 family glycosyltransferase
LDTDTVLFLDDDDEPASDLIERHLEFLLRSGADGSCGVLDEPGAPLPVEFQHVRISDVFPTSNTMVWRRALGATVFDPAFDRGVRADGEFGLRVYASGALLLLNPAAVVFHRRAASGGLRTFGERRTTFAASRAQLLARQIIAPTEVYLALRHFGREALVDAIWLRIAGSVLGTRGGVARRLLGAVVGMILLPDTLVRTWSAVKRGKALRSEEATR